MNLRRRLDELIARVRQAEEYFRQRSPAGRKAEAQAAAQALAQYIVSVGAPEPTDGALARLAADCERCAATGDIPDVGLLLNR